LYKIYIAVNQHKRTSYQVYWSYR